MSKYIEAEKLIAEIESISLFPQISADYNDGREDMKMMVLDLIDSLQQEQPSEEKLTCKTCRFYENDSPFTRGKFMPYPNIVCKDYTYSVMKEQAQVADASKMERLNVAILRDWSMKFAPDIRDAIKATAYHFWDLAIRTRMEQPEVDLEMEIERIVENEEKFMKFHVRNQLIRYVARHFYELAKNSK